MSRINSIDISDENIVYWTRQKKIIPPRPEFPYSFSKDTSEYWYDMEYAGWHVEKINIPESPQTGIQQKRIYYFLPGEHAYIDEYASTLCELAKAYEVMLTVFNAKWDYNIQQNQVLSAIEHKPDLMVILPINLQKCTDLFKEVNASGIPVIAGNFLPKNEGFKYILAWSGPDDWCQFRMLSQKFAQLLNNEGGYCIIRHLPDNSSYFARTYSVITELKKIAPNMKLLDMDSYDMKNKNSAKKLVMRWIKEYGKCLNGIISADDNMTLEGMNEAISLFNRHDIIRVAAGSNNIGLDLVKKGQIHAITFQSASIDASISFKLVNDWFEGLIIEPIRYLPVNIITKENIDDFTTDHSILDSINPYKLYLSICSYNLNEINVFYEILFNKVIHNKKLSKESINGFLMELVAVLLRIIRENNIFVSDIFGSYEYLYKRLFNQPSVLKSIIWLENTTYNICKFLTKDKSKNDILIDDLLSHVKKHYTEPLSLKILSSKYNISSGYLGQLFRKRTGESFSNYLNTLRIEKAESLLISTSMSAKEIATTVGFENPDYFYYVFKKITGYFPSQA